MIATDTPTHLTLEEVASLFRVSGQTIKRWLGTGRFPKPIRAGHRWLFPADDIHAHLEGLRAGPESQPEGEEKGDS